MALAAVLLAGTPGIAAATGDERDASSGYVFRLRAAAIEPEVDIPNPLVPGIGYSDVRLWRSRGETGTCEARGAATYWTYAIGGPQLQSANDPSPSDGIFNPTEASDRVPGWQAQPRERHDPQVRSYTDGTPVLDVPAHGDGVRWEANCADAADGAATGASVDLPGAQAAGSATAGGIDERTGGYRGSSRAYVAGLLTPGGTLDLVSSVMAVRALPGREPLVSYRIGTTGGMLASGADVPLSAVTTQFNRSVRENTAALDALGPFGLTLMGPTTSTSENGHRPILNAPFLELTAGLAARKGTIGENTHTRLVNIDFEGLTGR